MTKRTSKKRTSKRATSRRSAYRTSPVRYVKKALTHLEQAAHDIDMAGDGMSNRGYVKSLRLIKKVMAVRKQVASLRKS